MKTNFELITKCLWRNFSKEKIVDLRLIPLGFKNKSYVKSENGEEFVLKTYTLNFLTKIQIEERGKIVKTLENKGLPVLELVRGLNGDFTQECKYDGNTYLATLSKYVNVKFTEIQINKNVVITIAKQLRRLHLELNEIKYSTDFKRLNFKILDYFLADSTLNIIRKHFSENIGRSGKLSEFLAFYVKEGQRLQNYFDTRNIMLDKTQLNHGDFNLNNIFVENKNIVGIFDFDEMVVGPKSWDIALTIYALDYPEEFYTDELLQIFIEAYYEKLEINAGTITDILEILKFRAFNRIARYFTNFQYKDNPGGHFTKFRRHLEKFKRLNTKEIFKLVNAKHQFNFKGTL